MGRAHLLGIVFGMAVSLAGSAVLADPEKGGKEQVAEEKAAVAAALARIEIVEVVESSWGAVAEGCGSDDTLDPAAPGRLLTLRTGEEVYRIFLVAGRAIHCARAEMTREDRPAGETDPALAASAETARQDLAGRLSLAADEIELLRAERVRWRDSSAGCPEPDRFYMPMLTDGARFVLAAEGREYSYHQVGGAPPFWCEHPSKIEPLPGLEVQ